MNSVATIEETITTTGQKYAATENLDVKDVAKLIRQDLKAEQKAGGLPTGTYSVRIDRYSMGQSIWVTVTGLPFSVREPDQTLVESQRGKVPMPWLTREAYFVYSKVEAMVEAYNQVSRNPYCDYIDMRFGVHVRVG